MKVSLADGLCIRYDIIAKCMTYACSVSLKADRTTEQSGRRLHAMMHASRSLCLMGMTN